MTEITGTQLVVSLVVCTAAAMAVFRHADRRHDPHATAWGVGTFLALAVAVPLYLVHVSRDRRRGRSHPAAGGDASQGDEPE